MREILLRDPCSYCGKKSEQVDHIEPRSRGGEDSWENFTAACEACNRAKIDTPLLHFLLKERIPRKSNRLKWEIGALMP